MRDAKCKWFFFYHLVETTSTPYGFQAILQFYTDGQIKFREQGAMVFGKEVIHLLNVNSLWEKYRGCLHEKSTRIRKKYHVRRSGANRIDRSICCKKRSIEKFAFI